MAEADPHASQKLKVTDLKELLHKHNLPQTGKKDDLVKRLLENNIAPEAGDDEELVCDLLCNARKRSGLMAL